MRVRGGRLLTFVGQSGSGKTTQMRELVATGEFRICPSTTTRAPRPSDLPNEYFYRELPYYKRIARSGRFLWDIVTGNGDRYAKDICDVMEALTDPDHVYVNGLVPDKAKVLAQRYGSEVVRTVLFSNPTDDELIERMTRRGDSPEKALQRLHTEKAEDWMAQAMEIDGIYVVESKSITDRNQEILDLVAAW